MSTVLKLPHWDMTPVYPGLESVEFEQGFRSIVKEIDQLRSLFNNNQVDRQTSVPVDDDFVKQFEEVASALNDVTDRLLVITAYIRSFIATDSFNDLAQA